MEKEDDTCFDKSSEEIIFKVRALKGRLLAILVPKRPTAVSREEKDRWETAGLPKHYHHRYFDLLRRFKAEGVEMNIYTNRLTAVGQINDCLEDLSPAGLFSLREGSFRRHG